MRCVCGSTLYAEYSKSLPETFGRKPCVRWPPAKRSIPIIFCDPSSTPISEDPEVDEPWIRAVARDEEQRALLVGALAHDVVVDEMRLRIDVVRRVLEELAGDVRPEAVRQMASREEVHPHHLLRPELDPDLGRSGS